ncbi:hypothetical protein EYF80_007055 [Liparis tanakae]|uniref:Uncharacterized protein n=1 Tax=Liparis tanakae TaxID=230148 RepID=A0A4Z2IXP1_9TELE|nr:hypothetical protein EYF80_007055 [Liparis tanakae]
MGRQTGPLGKVLLQVIIKSRKEAKEKEKHFKCSVAWIKIRYTLQNHDNKKANGHLSIEK